ncbi:MAG: hypothetical protein AAFR65_15420 [Pseudomonadota bacterium]
MSNAKPVHPTAIPIATRHASQLEEHDNRQVFIINAPVRFFVGGSVGADPSLSELGKPEQQLTTLIQQTDT